MRRKSVKGNILTGSVVFMMAAQIFILSAGSPAVAITGGSRKEMQCNAVKAHPHRSHRTQGVRTGRKGLPSRMRLEKKARWRTTAIRKPSLLFRPTSPDVAAL